MWKELSISEQNSEIQIFTRSSQRSIAIMRTSTVSLMQKESCSCTHRTIFTVLTFQNKFIRTYEMESGSTYLLQHLQLLQVSNKNLASAHGPNCVRATWAHWTSQLSIQPHVHALKTQWSKDSPPMLNKSNVEMTAWPGFTFSVSTRAVSSLAWLDVKVFVGYCEAIEWDIFLFLPTGTSRRKCGGRARNAMRIVEEIIMNRGKELRGLNGLRMPVVLCCYD